MIGVIASLTILLSVVFIFTWIRLLYIKIDYKSKLLSDCRKFSKMYQDRAVELEEMIISQHETLKLAKQIIEDNKEK